MEVTQPLVGIRTRARAMAVVTDETADNKSDVKRRKLSYEKLRSTFVQSKSVDCDEIHVHSILKEKRKDCCDSAASYRSGGVPASCCSSTGSMEELNVSDLDESVDEVESTETKNSIGINNAFRTELPAGRMPPEAELEEFFAAANEELNEHFKNKYNYDILNDIPLEGRFEWIQVKPAKASDDDD